MRAADRLLGLIFLGLAIGLAVALPATAESAACAQARFIVNEVEAAFRSAPDPAALLGRLATARNLCPMLGAAWKISYCYAQALGHESEARIFRDHALLDGVSDLSCPAVGVAPRAAPRPPLGPVHAKYALVVGIGRFRDPQISQLRFAAQDASDLANLLTDPRYGRFPPANVILLTDEKATRKNILDALQELILKAREDDLVLLYVSSHGSPRQDSGLSGVGYIVTHDTALKGIWVDALEYEDFSRKVTLLKARRKAIFLDTCYSGLASPTGAKGLLLESAGVATQTARLFLSGEGTYIVTSSRADERSFESESLANSYFTHFLVAALKSETPKTLKEVFDLLTKEVPAAVARDKGQRQHPQLLPEDGPGDLRIGVAAESAGGTGGER